LPAPLRAAQGEELLVVYVDDVNQFSHQLQQLLCFPADHPRQRKVIVKADIAHLMRRLMETLEPRHPAAGDW
jgi:hypothetical protein